MIQIEQTPMYRGYRVQRELRRKVSLIPRLIKADQSSSISVTLIPISVTLVPLPGDVFIVSLQLPSKISNFEHGLVSVLIYSLTY